MVNEISPVQKKNKRNLVRFSSLLRKILYYKRLIRGAMLLSSSCLIYNKIALKSL